jgi:hypothetical protein
VSLTFQQQVALARAYAPILIFHPDEQFVPIKPQTYIERAALWQGRPPTDLKTDWGITGPGWPRKPTIPKGGISVDPSEDSEGLADPDGDGVGEYYLGHRDGEQIQTYLRSDGEVEHWLDSSGWADSQDVTDGSENKRCNKEGALEKWRESPGSFARVWSDWYSAEVMETSDLERILLSVGDINSQSVEQTLRDALGDVWIIWYYFLYPIHEEYLRRCEQIFDSAWRGDYEGDWNAVGVVVRQSATFPWEGPAPPPVPLYVAYGVRLRGVAKYISPQMFSQGMVVRPWDQVSKLQNSVHPRVFVTKGYHNNYSTHGDKDPVEGKFIGLPIEKLACGITEEVGDAVDEAEETLEDVGETLKDIGVTLAKMVAGAGIGMGIGGPLGAGIGALAGIGAGILEGLATSNTDDVPPEEVRKALEREIGPKQGTPYGLVLKPDDVANPLLPPEPGHPERDESATEIRNWNGIDVDRMVIRSTQTWWPSDHDRRGYDGRWGVRCQDDPNTRRSGIQFPDFRATLLNDLAVHLVSTDG